MDDLEEGLGEALGLGGLEELGKGAFLGEFSAEKDADAITKEFGFSEDVCAEDNTTPVASGFLDGLKNKVAADDIESCGGFIKDQKRGLVQQSTREIDPLFLACGEGCGLLFGEAMQCKGLDKFVDAVLCFVFGDLMKLGKEVQKLDGCKALVKPRASCDKADLFSRFERGCVAIYARELEAAFVGFDQSGDHA